MNVDKAQVPFEIPQEVIDGEDVELDDADIELEIVNPDAIAIETEDGGMILDFSGEVAGDRVPQPPEHRPSPEPMHLLRCQPDGRGVRPRRNPRQAPSALAPLGIRQPGCGSQSAS